MSRLEKFRALSGAEKRTILAALCGLPMINLKLRLFGFKKYLAKLQRIPLAPEHPEIDSLTYPVQTSRLVNAAARFLFHREACLERSIMLWSLLRRKGIECELKIGVATEELGLKAHAWVAIDGAAINENPQIDKHFSAFSSSFIADRKDFS